MSVSALLRRAPVALPAPFRAGGIERSLTVVRHAQARRLKLAVDPRDGTVRLTLPPRAAISPALAWVETRRDWVEAVLQSVPRRIALAAGATIPFAGETLTIDWREDAGRIVRREGYRLIVGGPEAHLAARVLRWLKREALQRLEAETRACAAEAGVTVARVAIGDPKARWGSCASDGTIRYSWRLVLAPPEVLRATVAHEVAHRLHMDHSPAFHTAVARLFGRKPTAERAWLKSHGASLLAVRAEG